MSDPTSFESTQAAANNTPWFGLSGRIDEPARRLLNLLVLQALDTLPEVTAHAFPAALLASVSPPARLMADLSCLSQTSVRWREADGQWGVTSLLSYAGHQADCVEYAFSPVLAQLLAQPQGRSRLQLAMQQQISHGQALALYELCAPWVRARSTPWWSTADLRAALGHKDSAYYEEFKHFKAKVLKPALTALAEASDLILSVETRRTGRSVSKLRFVIAQRASVSVVDYGRAVGTSACMSECAAWQQAGASRTLALHLSQSPEHLPPTPEQRGRGVMDTRTRAKRLAVIHSLVSQRSRDEQEQDVQRFLEGLSDPVLKHDFERFRWMSSRNATSICIFWERRAPEAFAGLGQNPNCVT